MNVSKCLVILLCLGLLLTASTVFAGVANKKNLVIDNVSIEKLTVSTQKVSTMGETVLLNDLQSQDEPEIIYTASGRGGGETIDDAVAIPGMPFVDTGNTTGAINDYIEETCDGGQFHEESGDHVYSYTPSDQELVDIILCNSDYKTTVWVYDADTNVIACNRFHTDCGAPRSALYEVFMDSLATYYIVIDGDYFQEPNEGEYIIECSSILAPDLQDSVSLWPTIADNGHDSVAIGYMFNNAVDSNMIWFGSEDGGTSFTVGGSWAHTDDGVPTYGDMDYWGNDTTFYATQIGPLSEDNAARTYKININNIMDGNSWTQSSWNWSSNGWHDMRSAAIACESGVEFIEQPGTFFFGIISMVHSTTYTDPPMTDAPHVFYELDITDPGWATISWYNGLDGCNSTLADIDAETKLTYAVYDWYNEGDHQWQIFIRMDWLVDFDSDTAGGYTYSLDPTEHAQHPAVAAYGGNLVIPFERYVEGTPEDHDIVCFYNQEANGILDSLQTSVIVASVDDERFPRISHVSGSGFICTYIVNNELYYTLTADGGATWDAPVLFSGEDHVVSEYRASDISEGGSRIIWEYQPDLPDDTTVLIHFASTDLIADTDGDGVPDDEDNCPLIANELQEDADGDLIGDVCDECTDTDADGFGDPGYAANTCTEDNCPDTYNPLQEDTDGDNIGDACCCIDERGNADGLVTGGLHVDVADLVFLVDYLFKSGTGPGCPLEGNVDGNLTGGVPITTDDLVYLVDFLFKSSGIGPVDCY